MIWLAAALGVAGCLYWLIGRADLDPEYQGFA